MLVKVAGSILSSNFGALADEARKLELSGVDAIHIDVMDGHFVPDITLGPKAVAAINRATSLFLDVHLMIYNPYEYVEKFIESGADSLSFHFEATEDIEDVLNFIKKCGKVAGLAFNPETSFSMVEKYVDLADFILFMSVHPGREGQKFIPKVVDKIKLIRKMSKKEIQVDGGINEETGAICVRAGANNLVSGSYLYSFPDLKMGVQKLKHVK